MIHLLYIEDDESQAEGLALLFNGELDFECIIEPTLESGIRRLEVGDIDSIILDWELDDGMTGEQSIPKLKQIAPDTKLIIYSGHDSLAIRERALELGADEYLVKPLSPREVIRAIYDVTLKQHEHLFGKEDE
jgi:DNA-binding response OmpR family regulator